MIRFLLIAVVSFLFAMPVAAQDGNYLTSPDKFAAAWSKLAAEMGPVTDVAEVTITADEITVLARAPEGGAGTDRWRIRPVKVLFLTVDSVSGPEPVQPSGPVGTAEGSFFPLAEVPLDRLATIAGHAAQQVRLLDPGGVTRMTLARHVSILPQPAYGDVRWTIIVASARESATVTARPDGAVLNLDISQTERGRTQDFLTQDDWPFAEAQVALQGLVGTQPTVYGIGVTRKRISVETVSRHDAGSLATFYWNGSGFYEDFLVMSNGYLNAPAGNQPFSLTDVDLSRLPAVLTAARQASGIADPQIEHARAASRRLLNGQVTVHWDIEMSDRANPVPLGVMGARTTVLVSPGAEVLQVILPESRRAAADPFSGDGMLAALAKLQGAVGPETPVLEVEFRDEWFSVKGFSSADPSKTLRLIVKNDQITNMEFPVMMETGADLFPISALNGLDAARLDAILAEAVTAMGLPGAVVHRVTANSGAPFWTAPDGAPRLSVRVGLPPDFNSGGYVVFDLDGTMLDVKK